MSRSSYMTEYVSDLLLNVFDGLLMGELEIERRLLEVKNSLNLSNEDFIDKYITDDVVRREIIDMFPIQGQADKSKVDVGNEYVPVTDVIKESPKIRLFTGYNMKNEIDYNENATGKQIITQKGYDNIFDTVRNNLLITRRTVLREYINKGVPSFMINDGKVTSKVIITDMEGNPGENPKKIFVCGFKYKCYITMANDYDNVLLVMEGQSEGFQIKNTDMSPITFIDFEGTIDVEEDGNYKFNVKSDKVVFIKIIGAGANISGINCCNGYFSKKKYIIQIRYYNDFFFYKHDIGKYTNSIPNETPQPGNWNKKQYKIELEYGAVNSSTNNYSAVDTSPSESNTILQNTREPFINLRKGYNRFKVETVNSQRISSCENNITEITIGYSVLGK